MRVNQSGTFYDIYVKNDYYYNKQKSNTTNDNSVGEYMDKIIANVSQTKDLSGGISIHILPENSTDKSSSATEDVADDIIGTVSLKYSYAADEKVIGDTTYSTNLDSSEHYDKNSVAGMLDKLKSIYGKEDDFNSATQKYSDPKKYDLQHTDLGNGWESVSLKVSSNPFDYEVAELNAELQYGTGLSELLFNAEGFGTVDFMKMMIDKMIEDMKKNNQDSLLKIGSPSTRLSSIFQSLQEEKQKTNQ